LHPSNPLAIARQSQFSSVDEQASRSPIKANAITLMGATNACSMLDIDLATQTIEEQCTEKNDKQGPKREQ